jgi:hypothetical protein
MYHTSQKWFISMGASGTMNEPQVLSLTTFPSTMRPAIVSNQLTACKAKSIGSTSNLLHS